MMQLNASKSSVPLWAKISNSSSKKSLIERVRQGLNIQAVSSSLRSLKQAREGGIKVLEMDSVTYIDLTVDGADEIDPQFRMIKGGGGAHVREKIVASTSAQMIVIID